MTVVVISQPMLFPWPGFYEQMHLADKYFWLDDAQFSKGSFTNRIKICHAGVAKWMTVPLADKGSFQSIRALAAARDFRSAHFDLLRQAYGAAPFGRDAMALVEEAYAHDNLCDLLIASAEAPARYLGISFDGAARRTSEMPVNGDSWRRVLDIVLSAGGDRYLTGHGAAAYLDHDAFEQSHVAVEYMDYSKTPWPQMSHEFTPFVSILDLIANVGKEAVSYLRPATIPWRTFVETRKPA
jgi:hypothetical protein